MNLKSLFLLPHTLASYFWQRHLLTIFKLIPLYWYSASMKYLLFHFIIKLISNNNMSNYNKDWLLYAQRQTLPIYLLWSRKLAPPRPPAPNCEHSVPPPCDALPVQTESMFTLALTLQFPPGWNWFVKRKARSPLSCFKLCLISDAVTAEERHRGFAVVKLKCSNW